MVDQNRSQSDQLTTDLVQAGLNTRFVGQRMICCETIRSTNLAAKALAQAGAAEGTLVLAEEQTAGRGRVGRTWLAPRGTSLLLSLIFRPPLAASRAQGLTMACSLAVRDAIREVTGLPAQLKWPNDIMLRGRKMGGILTESEFRSGRLHHAVVGIGLNVNLPLEALPLDFQATSIQHELGRMVPRLELLQHTLVQIERHYLALLRGEWPVEAWAAALDTIGQRVAWYTAQGVCRGTAEDVDDDGALLLRRDDGEVQRVSVGDIVPCEEPPGKSCNKQKH
jgi:BirA family biotin operon repressor/biotin-[acetyl-CoA-carboxylase] ligase